MARSDLLRELFASYSRGDDTAFRRAASKIVDDERNKRHHVLAGELDRALHRDLRPGATAPLTLRPIPKGRDERPLLKLTKPRHEFDDLVLDRPTGTVLREVVEENQRRSVLTAHNLTPRQRLLLVGPPGTGKSASAHAIADALSLPVATAALSALTSSYLGDTARNVEAVVQFAEQTPCVLLLDEFDVLAQERGERHDHGEIRRVVAAVLQMLDELRGESVVVATSNHPELVDSAVWRRFDEVVPFSGLDVDGIAALIELRFQAITHRVSTKKWARTLRSSSPAEVELVCLDAMRRGVLRGAAVDDDAMAAAAARFEARRAAMRRASGRGTNLSPAE